MTSTEELKSDRMVNVHVPNTKACEAELEPTAGVGTAVDIGRTTVERIESAADELLRLRAQLAHVNERVRNLATILELATVVIGPSVERSELVLQGLTRSKLICDGLIAVTDWAACSGRFLWARQP